MICMTLDENIERWLEEIEKLIKEIKENLRENKDIDHLKFIKELERAKTYLEHSQFYLKKFE